MSTQIWLSSSSPLFTYSPSQLLPTSYNTGEWNTTSIPGGSSGNDTAHTITTPGSVIIPSLQGVSIAPIFQAGQLAASLAIGSTPTNGTPWTSNQAFTPAGDAQQIFHLDVRCAVADCSQNAFVFYGAWLGIDPAQNATATNVTMDDSSPAIKYDGFTTVQQGGSGASLQVTGADFNNTLSMTTTSGASASVSFQAAAIALYAPTSPSLTPFTAALDSSTTFNETALTPLEVHNNLIFFHSGLDPSAEHTLLVTAEARADGKAGLVLDRWVIWGAEGQTKFIGASSITNTTAPPAPTNTNTNGTITGAAGKAGGPNVGAIVGGVIGAVIGLALLFWAVYRAQTGGIIRPAKEEKKLNPWDQANLLQNMKNEEVYVTTVAKQRYVYPGLIAHGPLSRRDSVMN